MVGNRRLDPGGGDDGAGGGGGSAVGTTLLTADAKKRKEVNEVAKHVFASKAKTSDILLNQNDNDPNNHDQVVGVVHVPEFQQGELVKGKFLGKGHFGSVYEVRAFQPKSTAKSGTKSTSKGNGTGTGTGRRHDTKNVQHPHPVTSSYKTASTSSSSSKIWMLMTTNPIHHLVVNGRSGGGSSSKTKDKTLKSIDDIEDEDDDDDEEGVGVGSGSRENNSVIIDTNERKKIFMAQHCIRQSAITTSSRSWKEMGGFGGQQHARYAVKVLNQEVLDQPTSLYYQAILDMATETQFLSSIRHPNIVKLRAKAVGTPFDEKYFIVMDRLYDVLDKRLAVWHKKKERYSNLSSRYIFDRTGEKLRILWEERIKVAYDISSALSYLHDRRLIHRDLKPDNLGFDIRGDIKIFDFGLAKELPKANEAAHKNEAWKLTGETGTPRYMAPEVAISSKYNASCDVYSFCILFWEILSTKTPFELYSSKLFRERVWKDPHKRPYIDPAWPKDLQSLLRSGWAPNPSERHSMTNIKETIQKELMSVRRGEMDLEAMFNISRRSTFVFTEPQSSPKKSKKNSVLSFALSPFHMRKTDIGLGTTQQTETSSPPYPSSPRKVLRGSHKMNGAEGMLLTPRKLLALDSKEKEGGSVVGLPSPPMLCDDLFSDDGMDNADEGVNPVEEEDIDDPCLLSVSVSGLDEASDQDRTERDILTSTAPAPPPPPLRPSFYDRLQQEQARRSRIRSHLSELQQEQ